MRPRGPGNEDALVREAKALVNTGHVCPKILDIS